MGLRDMYSAGDIIEYEGGGRDYLVSIEGEEGLWVNACNPSWIERGLRSFCDECRPFFSDRLYEGAEVVGHLGGGTVEDASRWYEASLLMGGCEEPWYKKPLTPRRLRLFLKRCAGADIRTRPCRAPRPHSRDLRIIR